MSQDAERTPVVLEPSSALHRAARLTTIALLAIAGIAGVVLVAWSIYARQGSINQIRGAGIINGLRLAANLNSGYLAVIGAGAAAALALAVAVKRRHRIAYPCAILGSAAGIAFAHYALTIVTRLEDPRFAKKSPWVKAASSVTMGVTIMLALVIIASAVAWITHRRVTRSTA